MTKTLHHPKSAQGTTEAQTITISDARRILKQETRRLGRPINVLFTCFRGAECSPAMTKRFGEYLAENNLSEFFSLSYMGTVEGRMKPKNPKEMVPQAREADFVMPIDTGTGKHLMGYWIPSNLPEAIALVEEPSRPKLIPYEVPLNESQLDDPKEYILKEKNQNNVLAVIVENLAEITS